MLDFSDTLKMIFQSHHTSTPALHNDMVALEMS